MLSSAPLAARCAASGAGGALRGEVLDGGGGSRVLPPGGGRAAGGQVAGGDGEGVAELPRFTLAPRVCGDGIGADGLAGLGQVRGARLVEDRGGAQECAVGSPVAQVVGEVRLEDGSQLLGVRVTEGYLVEQPVGHGRERRDVGGQGLDRVPVLDQLGAGAIRKLQPVDHPGDHQPCGDHQIACGLIQFSGALQTRREDGSRRIAGQGAHVTGPGGSSGHPPEFESLLRLGAFAVEPVGQLLGESGIVAGRVVQQLGGEFAGGVLAQDAGLGREDGQVPYPVVQL
ncbi:hypothetical protein ACIBQ5_37310 [Streptomyces massasporeus]|uniref:hypothetical protein n=1 Tax=Streptomyces massasporeus TaxID=67324 RepID=UPI00379EFDAF